MSRRYILNPYYDKPNDGAAQVTPEWLKERAREYVDKIYNQRSYEEEYHGGAYTGIAGCAFGLLRAGDLLVSQKQTFMNRGERMVDTQLEFAKKEGGHRQSRYLLGGLSILVIRALYDHAKGKSPSKVLKQIEALAESATRGSGDGTGDDEMLVGRAGFLAAVLTLREFVGEDVLSGEVVGPVLAALVDSGRSYARGHRSRGPLMYQYHGRDYLGAAHGLCGILQMLLSFVDLLDSSAQADVFGSVDWLLSIQQPNGNIPSSREKLGVDKGDDELIHWCHGASGFVPLLITAYLARKEQKYLDAARRALDLIWQKGILLKGPGICHGVSSGAYAFLLFYRLTHEEVYLQRARCFALVMCSSEFLERARTPDRPLSLFEGIAGALCLVCDLANPDGAQFPLVPIRFPLN